MLKLVSLVGIGKGNASISCRANFHVVSSPSVFVGVIMPTYKPIDAATPLLASLSNLVAFKWAATGIAADFLLPHDESRLLRVAFDRPCIVRILDEMPLSTEEDDTPNEGLVSEHFAYLVEGAVFVRLQSWAWKEVHKPTAHYRFITGWGCMDVLTAAAPSFTVVQNS